MYKSIPGEMIGGVRVVESPLVMPVPKLSISNLCPCSDHVRNDMNAYLLKMFGKREVSYRLPDGTMIVSPGMLARIKQSVGRQALFAQA